MIPPYRLLFLDVDGTLVGPTDSLSPRTVEAIRRAEEIGCTPVICTGRSRYTARTVVPQIPGHVYGILLNGGVLYDWQESRILRKTRLPSGIAWEAVNLCRSFGLAPLCFAVEEDDRWIYTDSRLPLREDVRAFYADRLRDGGRLNGDGPGAPVSIEAYGDPERALALVERWRETFGEAISAYSWEAARYGCLGVHIHSAQVNKSRTAQEVCDLVAVPRQQAMAIGDEVNDLDLLRWAGLGIAMGNAHPDCLAAADFITGTQEEDGVAQAIERFVLRSDVGSGGCVSESARR